MDFEEDALKVLVGSRHVTKRRSGCSDRQNGQQLPYIQLNPNLEFANTCIYMPYVVSFTSDRP